MSIPGIALVVGFACIAVAACVAAARFLERVAADGRGGLTVTDQRETDHAAPFKDVPLETDREAAQRIAGIGRRQLREWYKRFRHYTHPGTYGDCGCGRAFSVAYDIFSDQNGTQRPRVRRVLAIWRRWERAIEEGPGGGQAVIPGAEREPQRQTLERKMAEPIRPRGAVEPCDIGLFAPPDDQSSLDL